MRWLRWVHRWLAAVVGVQLLAWVAGGIYFSWTKLPQIRAETLVRKPKPVSVGAVNWQKLMATLQALPPQATLERLEIGYCLREPVVRAYLRNEGESRVLLFSARDGRRLPRLTQVQAEAVAKRRVRLSAAVISVEYLTQVPPGHEYRNRPLPAYAVAFDAPGRPIVYVSADSGEVTAVRHDGWRVFDFLWMLHTLDFKGRDDINNVWLRTASLAALIALLSGYWLFFLSRR